MIEEPTRDRRAERREATRAEILDAAWELARAEGLAGLSLRDIATGSGCARPRCTGTSTRSTRSTTRCSPTATEHAARAAARPRLARRPAGRPAPASRDLRRASAPRTRPAYQLLFQRTIPDFEPSAESYALAVEVDRAGPGALRGRGRRPIPRDFDLWTAMVSGLASQQSRNDPGGDRWIRLIDDAVDMFVDHVLPKRSRQGGSDDGDHNRRRPAIPAIDHREAMTIAADRGGRLLDVVDRSSTPTTGRMPTDCDGWDVQGVAVARARRHGGATPACASSSTAVRGPRRKRRSRCGRPIIDEMTARAGARPRVAVPGEIAAAARSEVAPKAVARPAPAFPRRCGPLPFKPGPPHRGDVEARLPRSTRS